MNHFVSAMKRGQTQGFQNPTKWSVAICSSSKLQIMRAQQTRMYFRPEPWLLHRIKILPRALERGIGLREKNMLRATNTDRNKFTTIFVRSLKTR